MSGIVEKIRIFPEKGVVGVELAEVKLIKNAGLEGDYHADGGERQISILFALGINYVKPPKKLYTSFEKY